MSGYLDAMEQASWSEEDLEGDSPLKGTVVHHWEIVSASWHVVQSQGHGGYRGVGWWCLNCPHSFPHSEFSPTAAHSLPGIITFPVLSLPFILHLVLSFLLTYCILSYLCSSVIPSCLISMFIYCILSSFFLSFPPLPSLIYCILSYLSFLVIPSYLISPVQFLYLFSFLSLFLPPSLSFIAFFLISPLQLLHLVLCLPFSYSILSYISCSVNAPYFLSPL